MIESTLKSGRVSLVRVTPCLPGVILSEIRENMASLDSSLDRSLDPFRCSCGEPTCFSSRSRRGREKRKRLVARFMEEDLFFLPWVALILKLVFY